MHEVIVVGYKNGIGLIKLKSKVNFYRVIGIIRINTKLRQKLTKIKVRLKVHEDQGLLYDPRTRIDENRGVTGKFIKF